MTITVGMCSFSSACAKPKPSQELKIASVKPFSSAVFSASSNCDIVKLLWVEFSLIYIRPVCPWV